MMLEASRDSMDNGGLLRRSIPENEAFFILDILPLHRTRAIMQQGNVQGLSQNSSSRLLHATLSTLLASGKGVCSPVHWDSLTPTTNIESLVLPFSTTPFFYLSHISIEYPKNFSFIGLHLFIFGLSACATRIMFRKSHPLSVSSRIFPNFSLTIHRALSLMLWSLIHLGLSLFRVRQNDLFYSFTYSFSAWHAQFVENVIFSNVYCWLLYRKSGNLYLCLHF